jgi:hypothetical protein
VSLGGVEFDQLGALLEPPPQAASTAVVTTRSSRLFKRVMGISLGSRNGERRPVCENFVVIDGMPMAYDHVME